MYKYLLLFIITLTLTLGSYAGAHAESVEAPYYYLYGVDLSGLTTEQKSKLFEILRDVECLCDPDVGDMADCVNYFEDECSMAKDLVKRAMGDVISGKDPAKTIAFMVYKIEGYGMLYRRKYANFLKSYDLNTDGAQFTGKADAELVLTAFLDFECGYCMEAFNIIVRLLGEYPNDIKFVFMHSPSKGHENAIDFALAAEAAAEQDKFFEMSALLFDNSGEYNDQKVIALAAELKLDIEKFKVDMKDERLLKRVMAGKAEFERHDFRVTPMVFLNNNLINIKYDYEYFQNIILEQLNKLERKKASGK